MALALLLNYILVLELLRVSFCLSYSNNQFTRASASKLIIYNPVCFLKHPSEYVYQAQILPCISWIPNSCWPLKLSLLRLHPNCAETPCARCPQFINFMHEMSVSQAWRPLWSLTLPPFSLAHHSSAFSTQNAFRYLVKLSRNLHSLWSTSLSLLGINHHHRYDLSSEEHDQKVPPWSYTKPICWGVGFILILLSQSFPTKQQLQDVMYIFFIWSWTIVGFHQCPCRWSPCPPASP